MKDLKQLVVGLKSIVMFSANNQVLCLQETMSDRTDVQKSNPFSSQLQMFFQLKVNSLSRPELFIYTSELKSNGIPAGTDITSGLLLLSEHLLHHHWYYI